MNLDRALNFSEAAKRLREIKATVARINPPGRQPASAVCGHPGCGVTAGLIYGTASRKQFVVPVDCCHLPYPVTDGPLLPPSDDAMQKAEMCVEIIRAVRRDR